jgi:nitrogen regulatory protein PII
VVVRAATSTGYIKTPKIGDLTFWTEREFEAVERALSHLLSILRNVDSTLLILNNGRIPIVEISGTTHTLELANERYMLKCTNASGCTVTVPLDSSVDFAIGSIIQFVQWGAGQVTISPVSGSVTIRSSMTLKTAEQYATIVLVKFAANEWALFGEREA